MKIYVVSSRYGTGLDKPQIFKTEDEAQNEVKRMVLSELRERIYDKIDSDEDLGFDITKDDDPLLEYATEHDYCASYNSNGFIDTVCIGDDWMECRIDEYDIKT